MIILYLICPFLGHRRIISGLSSFPVIRPPCSGSLLPALLSFPWITPILADSFGPGGPGPINIFNHHSWAFGLPMNYEKFS
jgi:hypothetical protein